MGNRLSKGRHPRGEGYQSGERRAKGEAGEESLNDVNDDDDIANNNQQNSS